MRMESILLITFNWRRSHAESTLFGNWILTGSGCLLILNDVNVRATGDISPFSLPLVIFCSENYCKRYGRSLKRCTKPQGTRALSN